MGHFGLSDHIDSKKVLVFPNNFRMEFLILDHCAQGTEPKREFPSIVAFWPWEMSSAPWGTRLEECLMYPIEIPN